MQQETLKIDWEDVKKRVAATEASLVGRSPSAEQLARVYNERAIKLAARPVVDLTPQATVMAFMLAEERFALELAGLSHVIPFRGALPVPGSATEVLGLIAFLGEIHPVIELSRLVGVEPPARDSGYVIMLRRGRERLGVRVRAIEGVETMKLTGPETGSQHGQFVKAIGADSLILIDTEQILKRFA